MGAPDDDNDDDFDLPFLESFEEGSLLELPPTTSSETCCDDEQGKKQLRKPEKMAILTAK
ncbi:unnamed protein product [Prunus armeniaca]|uniref:Uncharacterized protein n=1 Tax=Prunus armeniaca TaxID=36596 RepID=A0A6J5TWA2_PRUAR|nr:unnamed protein product [Prunus armeniaca]CAB4268013.1 unnamed protein product [Prunus armeniaca]CAB4298435.1 unnamed protein product [Prunus armeniaca]